MRASWWRRDGDDPARIHIGRDGLAMLALSALVTVATGGLTYALAMLRVVLDAARRPGPPADGTPIVVLGVRLRATGDVGPEFRERLDHGAALSRGMTRGGIVLLGGVTRAGAPSEAEAGKEYLIRHHGIAPGRIQCEARSHHTLENLSFYRHGPPVHAGAITLVTNRFHLARACLLARGVGLTVCPAPSDRGPRGAARVLVRLPWEGLLVHWYIVGRLFARVTGNQRMAQRIS